MDLRRLRPPLAAQGFRRYLPRRTIRLRLTLLYVGLFLASSVALLAITVTVWEGTTGGVTAPVRGVTGQAPSASLNPSGRSGGPASAGSDPAAQQRTYRAQLLIASGIALAVMTVLSVVLGWLMAGRILRPLRSMTATTRRISATNLHARLNIDGPDDELKELGETVDDLLARLERSFQLERQFVANASHELRTPLATMRASLDVAVAKPGPVSQQTTALADRLRQELDHVDELLASFLTLAKAQSGPLDEGAMLMLGDIVSLAIERCSEAISRMQLTVTRETYPEAWVKGSKTLLIRMVENVMDNAVKHNEVGGWIRVCTSVEDRFAGLVVENGGPVLVQNDVSQLAQPFRRIGPDRIGSDRGSGLGLAIVQSIAEVHGGALNLQARIDGGLRVGIVLPLVAPPDAART